RGGYRISSKKARTACCARDSARGLSPATEHDDSLPNGLGNGGAVGSGVGRGVIGFGFRVVKDGLATAHFGGVLAADADFVAAFRELLQSGPTYARLNRNIASA